MNVSRTTRLAILGALAGLVTWLVSEPFARTAANHGVRAGSTTFSVGSFYGWFAHMMLGATIVGFVSLSVSLERMRVGKALLWGLAALVLGGFLGWLSDSQSDQLCIRLLRSGAIPPHLAATLIWHFAVAMSLAVGIAVCTQPTVDRVLRLLAGGVGAALGSFMAPLSLVMALARGGGGGWQPYEPSRLVDHVVMGLILGLCVGLGETLLTSARLRLILGRNEGRDFLIGGRLNRLGSAEGIEVPLFGDPAVAPVHAQIWQQDGRWLIQDAGAPSGTWVNGQRIGQAWLQGGETIQVGSFSLVFLLKGQNAPAYFAPAPAPVVAKVVAPVVPVLSHRLIDGFGSIYDLPTGAGEIGREATVAVGLVHDGLVSRRHARVTVAGDRAVVEDLGSRNGTSVNGEQVAGPRELRDGDVIEVGASRLTYRVS
jgi:pSer/pThr/pTyr-binding forkhead associated (FHA) protein